MMAISAKEDTLIAGDREIDLLRLCSRVDLTDSTAAKIREIVDGNLDWPLFIKLAQAHKTVPLVQNSLSKVGKSPIPRQVAEELAFGYLVNAGKNQKLINELTTVARTFAQVQIDILPFKGPALALSAYGNLSLRQSGDLDILVRTQDVPTASKLLLELGYAEPDHLDVTDQRSYLQDRNFLESADSLRQYQFCRADGIVVELHWELGPRHFKFGLNNDELWAYSVPSNLVDTDIRALPIEVMFLLLVNHGSKHGWRRLSWICDIAELINRNPEFDWEKAIQLARSMHMFVMLQVAVRLASTYLDCCLPDEAAVLMSRNRRVVDLCQQVDQIHRSVLLYDSFQWQEHSFAMRAADRLIDRIRYGLFRLTTPTGEDWSTIDLPSRLSSLYRGVRLIRLVTSRTRRHRASTLRP